MAAQQSSQPKLRMAVEGCGHGTLHDIYSSVTQAANDKGWDGVDLVIIGGDFQAVRNSNDMACMAVPSKYKNIGDFHEYYSGARVAPYLTIFVGGNHEASNHLFELYYGGWVAPNIYYLGAANVIRCGPLRISGMSGIWKGYDYRRSHFERLPYDDESVRSAYHIREVDVRKLLQVRTQIDVGISHDWPQGIEWAGNADQLFRFKPHFVQDAESGKLGSPAARYVIDRLRPAHWFSAHLHVKYTATLEHNTYVPPRVVHAREFAQQSSMKDLALHPEPEITKQEETQAPVQEPEVAKSPIKASSSIAQPGGSEKDRVNAWRGFYEVASKREAEENAEYLKAADEFRRQVEAGEIERPRSKIEYQMTWKKVVTDDRLSREVTEIIKTTPENTEDQKEQEKAVPVVKNADEIDIDMDSASDSAENSQDMPDAPVVKEDPPAETKPSPVPKYTQVDGVSDDLRSQLPASFQKPVETQQQTIVEEPFPEAITNKTTQFLALDKCLPGRRFLELLEVHPISASDGANELRPYQLKYDKEWLAINRVFAEGFEVGSKVATFPRDQGTAFYNPKIIEAEAWVEENIVKKGKMTVPHNFTITAPVYDPVIPVTTHEQPFEYANPQTAQFCDLIGIVNPFHQSEEKQREQQEAITQLNANPPPPRAHGGGSGRFRGGQGFPYGRGRGGRGGRGGYRGGRGRGRGGS